MDTAEILEKITSGDGTKVWESAGAIIALSQDREQIATLLPYASLIKERTAGLDLGGAFAPNSRFVDYALRILEFHKKNPGCTCALYADTYECNNPGNEVKKGNIAITDVVRIENKWVDYYVCRCLKCGQEFNTIEREGHYTWWQWTKI